jgi:hypothetical protein
MHHSNGTSRVIRRYLQHAHSITSIRCKIISIITPLSNLHNTVPAPRQLAGVGAAVSVKRVRVVALLDASLDHAIAAACGNAAVSARIGVDHIAVVAEFSGMYDPVSAASTPVVRSTAETKHMRRALLRSTLSRSEN